MIALLLLAVGVGAGLPWWRALLLAVVLAAPVVAGAAIALVVWRSRPGRDISPAVFCSGVASELKAGATLRHALAAAASSIGVGEPATGATLDGMTLALAKRLPSIAEELTLTIRAAERSGAAADMFEELATLALARDEVRREVSMASASGKATALILVGAPALYVTGRLTTGGLGDLLATTPQRVAAMAGLGMFAVGLVAAMTVIWTGSR